MVSISITTTQPGARIFVDSKDMMTITPAIIDVPPGMHYFFLTAEGFQGISAIITVAEGAFYFLTADMQLITDIHNTKSFKISNEIAAAAVVITVIGGLIVWVHSKKNKGGRS